MANKLNIAPTKSNLLAIKEQLAVSTQGYDLLEQKREILVMELMRMVEKVKLLEKSVDACIEKAYPALKRMLLIIGGDRVERIAHSVNYDFSMTKRPVVMGGMSFTTIDVVLPKRSFFLLLLVRFLTVMK